MSFYLSKIIRTNELPKTIYLPLSSVKVKLSEGTRITKRYENIVKKHYDEQAMRYKLGPQSTMPDQHVRMLEIKNIIKYLDNNSKCLEVGCGNGWASVEISKLRKLNLTSVETNKNMFKLALKQPKNQVKGKLEFIHGNIIDYAKENFYDAVFGVRCVINIMEWNDQKKALLNMANSVKSGGRLVLLEAFSDGLENLNLARKELELESIKPAIHNLHLDKNKVISLLENNGFQFEVEDNFLSSYYFWTRVIYPSIVKANNLKLIFNSKIDEFFSYLSPYGNFAHIKILSFRKTSDKKNKSRK